MPSRYPIYRICLPVLLLFTLQAKAQVINNNLDPSVQQSNMFNQANDSTLKTAAEWKEEQARIYYNYLNSALVHYPDTTLDDFHRYQPAQPWWYKDLGNSGTAARNQFFTPYYPSGLSLGYHIYDVYRLTLDSLRFYNTTRPYSAFSYMMGSKTEQNVDFLHTQNITPTWNFAARLRYISSPGFYRLQRSNGLSGSFNTNYQSRNQRYYLAAGIIYNRFKQDENGGLQHDSTLENSLYTNREQIPVNLPARGNGSRLAAVNNILRDLDFYIQNNYSFGHTDTIYNKDSTGVTYQFTPRFRIKHQLQLHSERHIFQDRLPRADRYFPITGDSLLIGVNDSIYSAQSWFYVDNKFSLNGFLGKRKELVQVEAGIGNRIDRFGTAFVKGRSSLSSVGNYLFGELKKEAFSAGQWSYQAGGRFFFTGDAVGNFDVNASVGKDLGKWGMFSGGFRQNLSNAPYAYTSFVTNYYSREYSFDKVSQTLLWAKVNIEKINLQLGVNNHLIANYLYYNSDLVPTQESEAFSLLQIYGRKEFVLGIFSLDNEIAWQQPTANAPVHVPALLLRHKIAIEGPLFKSALRVAAGVEARYHTSYYSDGYTPYFNQYFLQDSQRVSNLPECTAFFNFKVKSFRAFVVGDQLQQLFSRNIQNAPGYFAQNALFRFGFTWILVN